MQESREMWQQETPARYSHTFKGSERRRRQQLAAARERDARRYRLHKNL